MRPATTIPHYEAARRNAATAEPLAAADYARLCRHQLIEAFRQVDNDTWRDGNLAETHTEQYVEHARSARFIVDVGAERGFYTALARRVMPAESEILAIEPDPVRAAVLADWVSNEQHVHVLDRAAWDTDTDLQLVRPVGCSPTVAEVPGVPFNVRAVALDGLLVRKPVDLVKIDVEGAEGRVLSGMRSTLIRQRPVIVLEYHPWCEQVMSCTRAIIEQLLAETRYTIKRLDAPAGQPDNVLGGRMLLVPD